VGGIASQADSCGGCKDVTPWVEEFRSTPEESEFD